MVVTSRQGSRVLQLPVNDLVRYQAARAVILRGERLAPNGPGTWSMNGLWAPDGPGNGLMNGYGCSIGGPGGAGGGAGGFTMTDGRFGCWPCWKGGRGPAG